MNAENDVEVENLILNNVNVPEIDKPLSPTLNSGCVKSFNRKYHRKSRVKLVKRFELGKNEKTVEKQIQDFNEESFSLPEHEDLLNCFDRLEEIEKNRDTVYKVLLQNTKSNLTFKKPISPAPKRFKSSPKKSEETKLESKALNVIQDVCEKIILTRQPPIEIPKTSNFQTATGKTISITKENIEKHSKIFEDIINSSQSDHKRQNKFSSLKKVSDKTERTAGKTSFTQEICNSGVSDTQLMCALDNVSTVKNSASPDNIGFKGFSRKNLADSLSASCRFNSFHNVSKNNEKRKLEDSNSFSNKKLRLDIDLKPLNLGGGFSSASGKKIEMTTQAVNKGRQIFNDLDKLGKGCEFIRACDREISTNVEIENQLNTCTNSLPVAIKSTAASFGGFSKASGTKISVPVSAINKAKNVFENIDLDNDLKTLSGEKKSVDSSEMKDSKLHASIKDKLNYFNKLIGDDFDFVPRSNLVQPQVGKNASNAQPARNIKNKLDYFDKLLQEDDKNAGNLPKIIKISPNLGKFSSAAGKSLQLSTTTLKKPSPVFDDVLDKNSFSFTTPTKSFNTSDASIKKSKRKLGISSCRQISIPESKLEKAKLIFDEDFNGISPIKHLNPKPTTPQSYSCSTPVRNNVQPSVNLNMQKEDVDIKNVVIKESSNVFKLKDDSLVTFDALSEKNATDFEMDLKNEVKKLEERLTVMKMRHESYEKLKEEKLDCDKKPKPGILYTSKIHNDKMSLKTFVHGEKVGQNVIEDLFCIDPKNAANIHFKECAATVVTSDGATLVPNVKDLIGLGEIEIAFKAMTGVDPKLIHKGWIKNHYKWIIWKLASYERTFPCYFKTALSVEHVLQQLKYRYDREIDKVQRSAIRKILEKDDAPQKRMVLCVSDIKKLNINSYELELTDGWYSIRTIIDEPLCHQIENKNLQIGTKIITCGAELLNCDGCHPLDVTDLTCLKINFNCTRRAKWDTKLGYQKFVEPFPIPVHTIHPYGGIISSVDLFIARVYPFRYLDKSESRSVWRNKKAEERRQQEWENDRFKTMEKFEDDIRKECTVVYDTGNKNCIKRNINKVDISVVTCPMRLLEVIENSNDPISIQESLTPSQKSLLLDYKSKVLVQQQHEMQTKVKNSIEKLKMVKREVVPILKMLVVDMNGSSNKGFNFLLWQPKECHVQMLKENKRLTAYNVLPKMNGDLYASSRTAFKEKPNTDVISIFKRKLVPIEELDCLKNCSKNFSEFDTVGIVVELSAESDSQEIWLCNSSGRLLVIKIFETPATCLLLDGLKRGQATSVCNLMFRGLSDDVCRACADHFTVFSSYPKYKHLQKGLDDLKQELPEDVNKMLEDCDSRIDKWKENMSKSSFSVVYNYDEEDTTLMTSRITSTDIALSLIDMDKFI